MAAIEPMSQFMVKKIVDLPRVQVPGVGSLDLSITNSVMFMLIASVVISTFFLAASRRQIVPGRLQSAAEAVYELVDGGLAGSIIGDRSRPFLPFVFTLFAMIAVMNMVGLIPMTFTVTSQLAVTAVFATFTFLTVLTVGFLRNGLGFFKLFAPSGVSIGVLVILAPLEFLSFMIRPITLALRLFGNMMAGHIMVYLFGSFVVGLGLFAMHGGLASFGFVGSALSLSMIVALMGLELLVAFLQAFVFAALTCVYLSEVVNLDHGH